MINFKLTLYPEPARIKPVQETQHIRTMYPATYNYASTQNLENIQIEDEITRCIQLGLIKNTSFIKNDKSCKLTILGYARNNVTLPKVIVGQVTYFDDSNKINIVRIDSDELLLEYTET